MQSNHYPFKLMELPFCRDALEPHIDTATVFFHHEKHQKKYVENLNALLTPFGQFYTWPLERLIIECDKLPTEIQTGVRNNAGGVYNHNIYFSRIGGIKTQPCKTILEAICSQFGSFSSFKERLTAASLSQFGSGYGFLTADKAGQLVIMTTSNQDTVLTRGVYPLIAVDVWEHAYYLKYQNRREEYINNLFCVLNWRKIDKIFETVISQKSH